LWGLKYDTGSSATAAGLLQGKGNVQLSTGQIAEINLRTAFTTKFGRGDTSWDNSANWLKQSGAGAGLEALQYDNSVLAGRRSGAMEGMPPTGRGLLVVAPPQPIKSILHIRKR
jgi:hypothetical protein